MANENLQPDTTRCQSEIARLQACARDNFDKALAAMEENERLKAALRGLLAHEPDYPDTLWQEARAALSNQDGK